MNEGIKWILENVLKENKLATVLLVLFILMFMGILPSPMLSAIGQITEEHTGMLGVMRQICINTLAKPATPQDVNLCFFQTPGSVPGLHP